MPILRRTLERSGDFEEAAERFLDLLRDWALVCMERYGRAPATDGHDQATFATAFEPLVQARPEETRHVLEFLKTLRDRIRARHEASGAWWHGYWRRQEVHHGTEHFEIFLGALARLDPHDAETLRQVADAAEHTGNFAGGVPPWFDWERGLFRSMYLGTEEVREAGGALINVPDHFRPINIALIAHALTQDPRYLQLAQAAGTRWAEALEADPAAVPVGLDVKGPVYGFSEAHRRAYDFAGAAPPLEENLGRAENILASDGHRTLLHLWQRTGEARFRRAAEGLLDRLAAELRDPDGGVVAGALRAYHRCTGEARYGAALGEAAQAMEPQRVQTLGLDPDAPPHPKRLGVGKRKDQPAWFEDGQPRRHSAVTMAAAAEHLGDERLATEALDWGRTQLALAQEAWPETDGRDHGCAARSVSAIARGHGRENHTGVVTGVLQPLWAWHRARQETEPDVTPPPNTRFPPETP